MTFKLDAVLTPENQAYAAGNLVFGDVTRLEWIKKSHNQFTDATGEVDLGNIDILRIDADAFVAEGDWGEVRIIGSQPRFELDG
ncbi:hypothetical protein [Mycolicibacterium hodleri]|uniref:hypothetical protein n=1 Tax=Mycolicibacterium hodleri TaxID=49897 RepID=UPI001F2BBB0A|nr:hypothetical protein [Mycolicibacterium hodleri]